MSSNSKYRFSNRLFGLAVLMKRQASEMVQQELANEIGVSTATISRVERGLTTNASTYAALLTWMHMANATFSERMP